MNAGDLRQRVTVQSRTEVASGGDVTVTWATVRMRMPARVRPLQGRDLERARQIDPRISHEVTLRHWRAYRGDLDGGRARLVYHPSNIPTEDRRFEIIGAPIDVEEKHVQLEMVCREIV